MLRKSRIYHSRMPFLRRHPAVPSITLYAHQVNRPNILLPTSTVYLHARSFTSIRSSIKLSTRETRANAQQAGVFARLLARFDSTAKSTFSPCLTWIGTRLVSRVDRAPAVKERNHGAEQTCRASLVDSILGLVPVRAREAAILISYEGQLTPS